MVALILITFVTMVIIVDAIVQYNANRKSKVGSKSSVSVRIFSEASVSVPKGLYFDKTHTWSFMEQNGTVKIGIDDFLVHITGELNKILMKKPGEKIVKGEPAFTVIQNGKQLTINSPITGIIKSQNLQLADDSTSLKNSPFNDGWVYLVEPSNWLRETQAMIMADKYKEWLKNEFSRLKDFLATFKLDNNATLSPIVLQDGGELKDNVLEDFGPEVWEEFQTKFINTHK